MQYRFGSSLHELYQVASRDRMVGEQVCTMMIFCDVVDIMKKEKEKITKLMTLKKRN